MAVMVADAKQYVCTLTTGWRFTLPSSVRLPRGWGDGSVLKALAKPPELYVVGKGETPAESLSGGPSQDCYLGAGGKVVVPASLREVLDWSIGRKLAVTSAGNAVRVAPCCHPKQCRSCGESAGVKEIIPGLHLCPDCWTKYVTDVKRAARLRAIPQFQRALPKTRHDLR